MLLMADNRVLIKEREFTSIAANATAGSSVALTVANNDSFAANDYVIIGEIGMEKTELAQVSSVSGNTTITITTLKFDHAPNTRIYRIDYNQVEYSYATTLTGSKSVLTTVAVQPDDFYTRYEDTTSTSGFGFVRFKNSTSSLFSEYSSGVAYSGLEPRSLIKIIERVRRLLRRRQSTPAPFDRAIDDDEITDEINDAIQEITHEELWSFAEVVRTDSTVANQFQYDIDDDVNQVFRVSVRSTLQRVLDSQRWGLLHWDTDRAGEPYCVHQWGQKLLLYPKPSASANATQLNGAISATATTITVDDASAFQASDGYFRFIIDSEIIYATASTTTSTVFTGCVRGQEGTTAATHNDDATVTERDILIYAQREPAQLVEETDETDIPEPYGVALLVAAKMSAAILKDMGLSDRYKARYDDWLVKMKNKYGKKIFGEFGIVKESWEAYATYPLRDPNDYPDNITGP